jgi:hypothetical protein
MGALGQFAPMPVKDECQPPSSTLWLAYTKWPQRYGNHTDGGAIEEAGSVDMAAGVDDAVLVRMDKDNSTTARKLLRGSKCPKFLDGGEGYIKQYSNLFPKTKLIIGIR